MFALLPAAALAVAGAAFPDAARYQSASDRLPKLVALYHRYGLPLPPTDAILVRHPFPPSFRDDDGRTLAASGFGFLVASCDLRCPLKVWVGVGEHECGPHAIGWVEAVTPDPTATPDAEWTGDPALAVQCQARGWPGLAEEILNRWCRSTEESPEDYLTAYAGAFWVGEAYNPWADRAAVARRLRAVFDTRRAPAPEWVLDLIRVLEASSAPADTIPGTVEALLEDLIAVPPVRDLANDRRVLRIVDRGLDAVPALLSYLYDERWVRCRLETLEMPNTRLCCSLGEVANELLKGLAGDDLGESDFGFLSHPRVDPAVADRWRAAARARGEEAYFAERVFSADGGPNPLVLALVARKYPRSLAAVCRKMLDAGPEADWRPVVRAVATSTLPPADIRKLLIDGCARKNLDRFTEALVGMRETDPDVSDRWLAEAFGSLTRVRGADCYAEKGLAYLALQTADSAVWDALAAAAKRAEPWLRLELLDLDLGNSLPPGVKTLWLDYQAGFLDDAELRDATTAPERFDGSHAGPWFPKLEVRNFAASQLGQMLRLGPRPDPEWTAGDWAKYRSAVRKALEREKRKSETNEAAERRPLAS